MSYQNLSRTVLFNKFFISLITLNLLISSNLLAICRSSPKKKENKREKVYQSMPFYSGEEAKYSVDYMGVSVGSGKLNVHPPIFYKKNWFNFFTVTAETDTWYESFFRAKDYAKAYSQASDFAVLFFHLEQDEESLFGKPFKKKKSLEFLTERCQVEESILTNEKKESRSRKLKPGAIDALSAIYKLRTLSYKLNKTERFLVYTSEKNWWLEATPEALEDLEVPAGKYRAWKLKLQTYLGKDLQQKGDVYVWIAKSSPNRPLIRVDGNIKIGTVRLEMTSFTPGKRKKRQASK